jgi:hypothetical protein
MRTSMGLSPPGPPRCLPSSPSRFWSHCSAPSGRSRACCFSSSCSPGRRFRQRFWYARSRRGAPGKFRCAATTRAGCASSRSTNTSARFTPVAQASGASTASELSLTASRSGLGLTRVRMARLTVLLLIDPGWTFISAAGTAPFGRDVGASMRLLEIHQQQPAASPAPLPETAP